MTSNSGILDKNDFRNSRKVTCSSAIRTRMDIDLGSRRQSENYIGEVLGTIRRVHAIQKKNSSVWTEANTLVGDGSDNLSLAEEQKIGSSCGSFANPSALIDLGIEYGYGPRSDVLAETSTSIETCNTAIAPAHMDEVWLVRI